MGSVWKSWDFMEKAFTKELNDSRVINEIMLLRLTISSAVGACYVAAEKIKCNSLIKTHEKNSRKFFHYKRNELIKND